MALANDFAPGAIRKYYAQSTLKCRVAVTVAMPLYASCARDFSRGLSNEWICHGNLAATEMDPIDMAGTLHRAGRSGTGNFSSCGLPGTARV